MRIIRKDLKVILFLVAIMSWTTSFAQLKTITGKVSDASDGGPLPGVTIVVKGTTNGTITNFDGDYSINVEEGQALVFSYIGYTPQEIVIGAEGAINVQLTSSTQDLDEVVVIGYGTVKKEDATGSITAVTSDDFNQGAITSAQELLVGKGSGVVITPGTGAPGSGATIRIRGGSSLNASNDPLIIIDGIPIDNNDVDGSTNFLQFVHPSDIESFNILKDASATAIYGSRASNGVIIITTKKGKVGSPMRINYHLNTSVANAVEFLDVYSGDELRQIALDRPELYGTDTYHQLWNQNTNWQKELFRTAVSMDNAFSVSGAAGNLPYRVSIGTTLQNGIMKNTDMQRLTGSVSLDPVLLDGSLKLNFNVKGMLTYNDFGDDGALGSALQMDPTKPVYDDYPGSAGYFQWGNYGASLGTPNPVEQLLEINDHSTVKRIVANAQANYALPFLPEMRLNLSVATDRTGSEGANNRPPTSAGNLLGGYVGKLNNYTADNSNDLLDFYINYKKNVESINSLFDVTAGYSWQHFQRETSSFTRGQIEAPGSAPPVSSSTITENYLVSFFGRLNYTYANKYLLTLTLRNDGSSRFIGDNQWGLFPSAALAWKISEEDFLKDSEALSELKLRLGWGVTGQQDIGNDYPAQASYALSSTGSYYYVNGKFQPTLRPDAYDPDIKWEETTTLNVGLDFGFFNQRLTGAIDVYKRVTDDLLNTVTIPTGSNFSNTLLTNVGSLENKGFELTLEGVAISKEDMSLTIGANLSYNESKITKLLLNDDPDYIGILYGDAMTGQNQVTRVGYAPYSFFVNKQVYDESGQPIEGMYVDLAGNGGTIAGDNNNKYIYKNPAPDYLIGFSARFNYKNLDASFSSRGSIGNYVYNQVSAGASYDQLQQIGYWKNFPKDYLNGHNFVKRQFTSDYFVENASFFKMDNMSLGYTFESGEEGRFRTRLSFTVQNVFTITNYTGIDPEVRLSGEPAVPGIDENFYPRPRTYMLGISLTY